MAAKKSLGDRITEALDSVYEAREALDGTRLQVDELRGGTIKKLMKAMERLQKAHEDFGDAIDDVFGAVGALDTELENQDDLSLEKHVDALETVTETLDELNNMEFEE